MKYAYVTILSTNEYYPGVIALFESLKKTNTKYNEFVVIVNELIDEEIINKLKEKEYKIINRKSIDCSSFISNKGYYNYWTHTFDKFHVFDLIEYDKIVYLDSDLYILKNIDELFDLPNLSGAISGKAACPEWDGVNSGLLVIVPEKDLSKELYDVVLFHDFKKDIGDQDVINYYFDWPNKNLEISENYNLFAICLDKYINNYGYKEDNIKVIHFVGPKKPWMWTDEETKEKIDRLTKYNRIIEIKYLKEYIDLINNNK